MAIHFIDQTEVPDADDRFDRDAAEWYETDAWGWDPDYLFSDGHALMFETVGFYNEPDKRPGLIEYVVCYDVDDWTDADKDCVRSLVESLNSPDRVPDMRKAPGFERLNDACREQPEPWHQFCSKTSEMGQRVIAYRGGRGYCYGLYGQVA